MINHYENHISGASPFKPEFQEFIDSNPGRGSLKVQVSAANQSFPVKDVFVDVAYNLNGMRYSLYNDVTDASGIVNEIVLPSCSGTENNSPETAGKSDVTYFVSVYHPAFEEIVDYPVTIQDRVETILPVSLEPITQNTEG